MIRETTAADLLPLLAPLLASLPAVEALRLRLAPSLQGVRRNSQPQASLGLVPQRPALLDRRLDEPSPRLLPSSSVRRPPAFPFRASPPAG